MLLCAFVSFLCHFLASLSRQDLVQLVRFNAAPGIPMQMEPLPGQDSSLQATFYHGHGQRREHTQVQVQSHQNLNEMPHPPLECNRNWPQENSPQTVAYPRPAHDNAPRLPPQLVSLPPERVDPAPHPAHDNALWPPPQLGNLPLERVNPAPHPAYNNGPQPPPQLSDLPPERVDPAPQPKSIHAKPPSIFEAQGQDNVQALHPIDPAAVDSRPSGFDPPKSQRGILAGTVKAVDIIRRDNPHLCQPQPLNVAM